MSRQTALAAIAEAAPPWHCEALHIASGLTTRFRRKYQPGVAPVTPEAVVEVLKKAKVRFVLMGTYGIEGYRTEPRATQDVDVLVPKRDHAKAIRALRRRFPKLIVTDLMVVTRFLDPATKKPVIDVMKPEEPVFKMVLRHSVLVEEGYLIPGLEMALASKFAAMTSPNKAEEKKFVDAGDFIDMVKNNQGAIDKAKLERLGEKIYSGGGKEIIQLLDNISAGRRIEF